MNKSLKYSLLLALAAAIWGAAFVAQSAGMAYVGPFTFNGTRCFIGFLVLIPVSVIFDRKKPKEERSWFKKDLLIGGLVCGVLLFLASSSQQIGIMDSEVGKAGFMTALYIVIVPIFSLVLRKKPGKYIWFSVLLAVIGLYFLCITKGSSFTIKGADIYLLACAFLFAMQIMACDIFAPKADVIKLTALEFLVCAILSIIPMVLEKPVLSNVLSAWVSIGYAGVLSCGIAYTLQMVGQKYVKASVASLVMSLESAFSVFFGFLILHETLSLREGIGCVIMFIAIIIAQITPGTSER